jgi:N-acylglucosamine 2-epimerase
MSTAKKLFDKICEYYFNPNSNVLPPKVAPQTRPMIGHAVPMILISTAQILRQCNDCTTEYDELIEELITTIFSKFVKDDYKVLLETVTPEGDIIDTPEGRIINPGHAIETSWFLMHEGIYRNNYDIIKKACDILSWSFERGWDEKYSGLFSFVDLFHLPPEKVEWDMKYWWPHNELIYASLLAYHLTGKVKWKNNN